MACNYEQLSFYPTIEYITRNNNILYCFIGNHTPDIIYNILQKIENNTGISNKEKEKIQEYYKYNSDPWFDKSTKTKIKFIKESIYIDDTISILKKKIFYYLGNNKLKFFENNQELWQEKYNKYFFLGYKYCDSDIKPSVYNDFKIDHEHFYSKEKIIINYYELINNNQDIIYDYVLCGSKINTKIFLSLCFDEIDYLKAKNIKIHTEVVEGYLKKFWPKLKQENDEFFEKSITNIRSYIETDKYIHDLINSVYNEESNIEFSNCNIISMKLDAIKDNKSENDSINLFKIFNFLRKSLSEDMPFIKYKDSLWLTNYTAIYDGVIKNKIIPKKIIKEWLFNIKKDRATKKTIISSLSKGLQIKLKIPNTDDEYFNINIYKNTKVEIKINFQDYSNEINGFDKIMIILKSANNLIDKINLINFNLDLSQTSDKINLVSPNLIYKYNYYFSDKYTTINSINYIFKYDDNKRFEFKDFYNLFILFKTYISPILDNKIDYDFLNVKYKRVSKFKNMPIIYDNISQLKEDGTSDYEIISYIEKHYDKTLLDAKSLLLDWKKRTGYLQSKGLMRQTGVDINMEQNMKNKTGNNVFIFGCKNTFQFLEIYKFIYTILNIYKNIKKYGKDTRFQKYIIDSNNDIFNDEYDNMNNQLNIDNINNINNIDINNNINLDLNLNNTNINKYLQSSFRDMINDNKDEENKAETPKIVTNNIEFAPNSEIGKDITISAQDCEPNYEIDSCKDLCDDTNYTLRRLQRYDNNLFHFKDKTKKFRTFWIH